MLSGLRFGRNLQITFEAKAMDEFFFFITLEAVFLSDYKVQFLIYAIIILLAVLIKKLIFLSNHHEKSTEF